MVFVRSGIPLLLAFPGIGLLFTVDKSVALEAWAGFTGAAIAVFLLNLLFRIGVQGDLERDREDEARAYFDRHGRWPGEGDSTRPDPPPHRESPESRRRATRPPRRR